jgi:DNA mismatch repair protein MutS
VKEGPASQSYGIAVASLAGVPIRVIRRAKGMLQKLEDRAVSQGPQLDLFANGDYADAAEETIQADRMSEQAGELIGSLKDLDVDSLSPREALRLLYEIKQKAQAI